MDHLPVEVEALRRVPFFSDLSEERSLEEAERQMRRAVEILLLFSRRTGYEHPHLNTVFENYRILLTEMGHDEEEAKAMIQSLVESVATQTESPEEA